VALLGGFDHRRSILKSGSSLTAVSITRSPGGEALTSGLAWQYGAAAWAALKRKFGSTFGSSIIPVKNSSGVMSMLPTPLAATASMAAAIISVVLFGEPGGRPPPGRAPPCFFGIEAATGVLMFYARRGIAKLMAAKGIEGAWL
jgi:hypothetical protein